MISNELSLRQYFPQKLNTFSKVFNEEIPKYPFKISTIKIHFYFLSFYGLVLFQTKKISGMKKIKEYGNCLQLRGGLKSFASQIWPGDRGLPTPDVTTKALYVHFRFSRFLSLWIKVAVVKRDYGQIHMSCILTDFISLIISMSI